MNGWAKARLAPTIAAILMTLLMTLPATPSSACDTTTGCPAGASNTDGLPANMLPTYAETKPEKQEAAPMNLRKFTRKQTRSARRASSRKALASQGARSKQAAKPQSKPQSQEREAEASHERTKPSKLTPALANANAELTDNDAAAAMAGNRAAPDDTSATPAPAASPELAAAAQGDSAAPSTEGFDVVSAEDFNEVDRTAWDAPESPRLMQLTTLDSRAEMRSDDSKWNRTSTVGKLFVAFGALLTIGSAIRMFIA